MLCEPQIINFYNKDVSLSEEQADKIFDLQKENKQLKEENEKLRISLIKVPKGSMNYAYMKELEEENNDLENKIVEQDVEISNLKSELEDAKKDEELFNKIRSERDDLSEEIERLQLSQICCDCQVGGECEGPRNCANGMRIKKLQEEIERLKEENKKFIINGGYVGEGCANYMAAKLKDDLIIKLREENEKLKEEISNIKEISSMEEAFDMVQNLTEELVEKEERLMDLEKQLKTIEEENKQNCIEKITLQRVSQFYNELHPDGVSVADAMGFLDEHLDCYGNDKYKMFVDALEYILGIGNNSLFDENELREEYEEMKEDAFEWRCIDIEDIVEEIENYTGDHYYELNVDKPDGTRVWIKY
tara:strand:+ start:594 stop:1679 length:1086 start_codon:yes stop_codon:yes gene_type:complete